MNPVQKSKPAVKRVKKTEPVEISKEVDVLTPPATPDAVVEHYILPVDDLISVLTHYKKSGSFRLIKKRVYKKKTKESESESS